MVKKGRPEVRVGRPKVGDEDRLINLVQVTITDRQVARLDVQVARLHTHRATLIRHALLGLLEVLEAEDQGQRPGGLADLVPEPLADHPPAGPATVGPIA